MARIPVPVSSPEFPAASPPQCWQCIWCLRKRWPSRNEVTSADSKFFGIWRTVRTRCYFSQIAKKTSTVFPPFFSIFALTPVISGHCPHLSQGCNPLFPIFSPFFSTFFSSLRLCQLLGAPSCGPKSVDHGGQGQAQRHLRRQVWTRVLTWRKTSRKQDRFRYQVPMGQWLIWVINDGWWWLMMILPWVSRISTMDFYMIFTRMKRNMTRIHRKTTVPTVPISSCEISSLNLHVTLITWQSFIIQWRCPKVGAYPHPFSQDFPRIFRSKPSSSWGTPITMKTHQTNHKPYVHYIYLPYVFTIY